MHTTIIQSQLVGCEGIPFLNQLCINQKLLYIFWSRFCKLDFHTRPTRIHGEAKHIHPCICIETILKALIDTFLLSFKFSSAAIQMTASNIRRYIVLSSSSFAPKEN